MEQMSLPFKSEEEKLADALSEEQFKVRGHYLYPRRLLIKAIKRYGLEGWSVIKDRSNVDFGFIYYNGGDVS